MTATFQYNHAVKFTLYSTSGKVQPQEVDVETVEGLLELVAQHGSIIIMAAGEFEQKIRTERPFRVISTRACSELPLLEIYDDHHS